MTAVVLLLLGVLVWIPSPSVAAPARSRLGVRSGSGLTRRQLEVGAAIGVAAVAVLIGGVTAGVVVSLVAVPLAVLGVRRLAAVAPRVRANTGLALAVDLAACALRAGQPVAAAVTLAAPAAGPVAEAKLRHVAGLLRLGADPADAWRALLEDPVLAPVAQAACRSATSGARLAQGWEQLAVDLRATFRATAEARAHRAGVFAIAPLGLCFLPAFVCVGVIPVVIGIARSLPGVGGG